MEKKDRLVSLDAFRGADMLFIMGFAALVVKFCTWMGWKGCWLVEQMEHVRWEGIAQHDTIFPTFLFIAGISWPFSYASQAGKGASTLRIVLRIFKRGLLLFLLGLIYNGLLRFNFAHLRIPGVLQYIGLSWMFSALIYVFVRKVGFRIVILLALLAGYWALLTFCLAPDAPAGKGSFSFEGNIVNWFDRTYLKGHLYLRKGDPESFISLMGGISTAMLGVFTGEIVRSVWSQRRKVLTLLGLSVTLLALGFAWQPWCPCIKKIWSPTFVLFAGAYSCFFFMVFYTICDVWKLRRWTYFFRVIGLNAITIYLGQKIIDFSAINRFFFSGTAGLMSKAAAPVFLAATYILVCWCFLWFLERKNVHLKV